MTTVDRYSSKTDAYLGALEGALEALGPDETREVIAEIRGLLAEAVIDAGEDAALADLGTPNALAAQILEERGVLSAESRVPEASAGVQAIALAIDVAMTLVAAMLMWVFIATPIAAGTYFGYDSTLLAIAAGVAVVAAVGVLVWWWTKKRRRPGYTSTGMAAVGVRRIQVGKTARIVRERDIPGPGQRRRILPIVRTALALLILASALYSVTYSSTSAAQLRAEKALWDGSVGTSVVTDVYGQVVAGAGPSGIHDNFTPAAEGEMTALLERYASGKFKSYAVDYVRLPDGAAPKRSGYDPSEDIHMLVGIREIGEDEVTIEIYEYHVSCIMTHTARGNAAGQFLIESVAHVFE